MKILLVADGRSPITRRWISMLQPLHYDLVLVSSYPCEPLEEITRLYTLPLAFAGQGGSQAGSVSQGLARRLIGKFRPVAQRLRHLLGPWMIAGHQTEFLSILEREQPDLVHALRIPFEGMLAACTPAGIPLLVSTWGNDLTYHAASNLKMSSMTRRTLQRTDGLLCDTHRDASLALKWGFNPQKDRLVVPGNGGLDWEELLQLASGVQKAEPPQVINPRGLRSYVRTDTFFKAIPLVLAQKPDVQFVCASMEGQSEAHKWVERLAIERSVRLLPYLSQQQLWREYARSQVMVSISEHDGTPNSLLEAMALGCLPVCGDLESIREWITDGENGLLTDPANPAAVALAILKALEDRSLANRALKQNTRIVQERAAVASTRAKIKEMYERYA